LLPAFESGSFGRGASGAKAQILEIDAGAKFTRLDVHTPGPEEVLHNPAGSAHVPQSEYGCVLFVFFPEG